MQPPFRGLQGYEQHPHGHAQCSRVTAYYTWIGTRSLPYTYSETPLPIVDNHMICTIRLNDRYIFLDGTDPTCVFGMPSEFTQDKQALVAIDDTSYKILTVPTPDKELNQLEDTTLLELTDKGLKGTIAIGLSGYLFHGHAGRSLLPER